MRRIWSWILAVVMTLNCCALLVTSVSAADDGGVLGSWSFDEESLTKKNDEKLMEALRFGTAQETYPDHLKLSVVNGALRLQNTTDARADLLICNDEKLMEGFTLEYDFRYANQTALPSAVGSTTRYNSIDSAALEFTGGNEATDAATWHVQPRINGDFLNSPKTNGNTWVDITKMKPTYELAQNVLGKWFTVRIVFSPESGVDAFIKEKGAEDWVRTDSYSPETLETAKTDCRNFVSDYLRLMVHRFVDVFVDNVTISAAKLLPRFVGYQWGKVEGDRYSIQLIGCIPEKEGLRVGCKIKTTTYDETTGIRREVSWNLNTRRVYKTLSYQDGGSKVTVSAEDLCEGMEYLFAIQLEDLPRSKNHFYEIIPYIETENGIEYGSAMYFGHAELSGDLPAYDTARGQVSTPISFAINNSFTTQVVDSTVAEMDAYVNKLKSAGYTLYQSRDNVNGNYFRTLYNDTRMIHVYFMPAENTGGDFEKDVVRIVTETTPLSEAFPSTPYGDERVTDASVIFMTVEGVGLIFTNPDGSYVIADGGWGKSADQLYNYLKDNNKRKDGRIVIRAWVVSHPHEDHWGNFVQFAKSHASKVTLEYVVTQLNQQYCDRNAQVYDGSKLIREAAAKFEGAKLLTPHTGQVMYFGELEAEFLATFETLLNKNTFKKYLVGQVDGNESSLVFRGKYATGKTVLFTGDIQTNACQHMDTMYETHLKSDIVTTPHHGAERTTTLFYPNHVRPNIVLIPASQAYYDENYRDRLANSTGTCVQAKQYVTSSGGQCYTADGAYRTFLIQ